MFHRHHRLRRRATLVKIDELLDRVSVETGLDDVGDPAFRDGLEVLLASLDDDAQLSELGRLALEQQLLTNLRHRLKVNDWISRHPHVTAAPVSSPIFILGMPRTGTTLLSYLLDQDPRLRSLLRWESSNGIPPPEAPTLRTDPRVDDARTGQQMLDSLNPGFKAIHHEAPDGPTECVAVTSQVFRSILWETVANVAGYGSWLDACDYGPAYQYHRQVLQVLQSEAPGRWSLKSPAHRLAPDTLVATYPDARLVVTHRDPVTVTASTCSLVRSLSGTFSDANHSSYIAERWTHLLELMVERVEQHRATGGDERFLDVAYAELVADPVGVARRVYDHCGLDMPAEAEAAIRAYVNQNRQGKHGRHTYALDDLGLDRADLEERFAGYIERYDIPREPR